MGKPTSQSSAEANIEYFTDTREEERRHHVAAIHEVPVIPSSQRKSFAGKAVTQ